MILTTVGEIGVHVGGAVYRLRPSLYAMTQLGEPAEIVEVFARVMGEPVGLIEQREQFRDALAVIHACSDDDLSGVFGYVNERMKYVLKKADPAHIVPLAQCLLKHGVVGDLPPLERPADQETEYVAEFNARDHVALAVAHLGASEQEAWQMTMTSFVGAMRAKFPETESGSPGSNAPSIEEHDATMEWFEKIRAARDIGA